MTLAGLVIFLLVVGIILWMFPLEGTIKKLVLGVIAIIVLVWIAVSFGWIAAPKFY